MVRWPIQLLDRLRGAPRSSTVHDVVGLERCIDSVVATKISNGWTSHYPVGEIRLVHLHQVGQSVREVLGQSIVSTNLMEVGDIQPELAQCLEVEISNHKPTNLLVVVHQLLKILEHLDLPIGGQRRVQVQVEDLHEHLQVVVLDSEVVQQQQHGG